ncbi:MAG: hypothetical protein ACQGVK_17685 [Myxococcota bacterium]
MSESPTRPRVPGSPLLEASLLAALIRGEREAFDRAFEAAFPCVLASIRREVEKDVRALELTDQVLRRAFSNLDPASPPASLAVWLAGWTRHTLAEERAFTHTP